MRPYDQNEAGNALPLDVSSVTATCPGRFSDKALVFEWIAEELLETEVPELLTEIPFLRRAQTGAKKRAATVGKIDMVLVHPDSAILKWCAVETQAVYFSGDSMKEDFDALRQWTGQGIPFPKGKRRPDFRSSGPKRLMPQLQIKVPTLRRWGKKVAVVIDLPFWNSLAGIHEEDHLSNCDVVWFVVTYEDDGTCLSLRRHSRHYTTLDRAVDGLTGGVPATQDAFEKALLAKIGRLPRS